MRIRGITRNVVALGIVSFLTDIASEMLYPVMPLFLTGTLGASPAILGLVDGVAEGISSGLRWIMGAMSDRFRRRKPFVVAGYGLSAFSKPLMGLAALFGGWPLFLLGRCLDRLGKSIRTSARDALIADSTEMQYRGAAFGFHRSLDTCGAVVGPLIALAVILFWPSMPLPWLFAVAFLPGLLSAVVALVATSDIPHPPGEGKIPSLFASFPRSFWLLLVANAIFSLGNSSDSFLILRSRDLGMGFAAIILAFACYCVVYAVGAMPAGRLSDRVGRKPMILCGWAIYGIVYLAFAWAHWTWAPWVLLPAYGAYQAFSEGISKAMVSDLVDPRQRAGAIGLFYTVSGLGQLGGSLLAGVLWNTQWAGANMGLAIGGALALLALPVLGLVRLQSAVEARTMPSEVTVS